MRILGHVESSGSIGPLAVPDGKLPLNGTQVRSRSLREEHHSQIHVGLCGSSGSGRMTTRHSPLAPFPTYATIRSARQAGYLLDFSASSLRGSCTINHKGPDRSHADTSQTRESDWRVDSHTTSLLGSWSLGLVTTVVRRPRCTVALLKTPTRSC